VGCGIVSCYFEDLRNLWLHVDNRCGHVSLSLFGCRVQLRLVNLKGQKGVFSMVTHILGGLEG
jgi:hypothetical protein